MRPRLTPPSVQRLIVTFGGGVRYEDTLARDPKHLDSQVDFAGYAAVLREVSR